MGEQQQQQQPMIEHVLRGPIALSRDREGDAVRHIIVTIGVNLYRIPLALQACHELSQALALTDDELAEATQRQALGKRLLVPSDNGHGFPGAMN